MNRFTGIVGVFNCQGAGWCKKTKKNRSHDTSPGTLTGLVRADVADLGSQVAGVGKLVRLPKDASIPLWCDPGQLHTKEHEVLDREKAMALMWPL
ncbi:BnaCnng07360D [Brassica napus]|uniref:BnaCnng07360D protein n=1 Tax=Brassica napus TaxID=3708 RepID=A0A078HAF0_BRANA|nr:BnaCnng07360D [Brassica napus]